MKKLLFIICILITNVFYSQIKTEGATAPDFNNGKIIIDTAGTKITGWAIYKVENGVRLENAIAWNTLELSGLGIGTYWILGQTNTDSYHFSLDQHVIVGMKSDKPCDSMHVNNYSVNIQQDPNMQGLYNYCVNYSVDKACGWPLEVQFYTQLGQNGPPTIANNISGCLPQMIPSANVFLVVKDCSCTYVYNDLKLVSATNYPSFGVPGTGGVDPINFSEIKTVVNVDCSGYYVKYNGEEYKVCNTDLVRNLKNKDSIIVSGTIYKDCFNNDTMVYCTLYHPNKGYLLVYNISVIGNDDALLIKEKELSNSIFPNPFSDKINTKFQNAELKTIDGKVIGVSKDGVIETIFLSEGTYFLTFEENGEVYTYKMFKN